MSPLPLSPGDLAIAASLVAVDAALSLALRLGLHRQLLIAAGRMVVQLVVIGYVLKLVFALRSPAATLALVAVMTLVAAREVAARPQRRLKGAGNLAVSAGAVTASTALTVMLALLTAVRPQPWFDPHYAVPLAGIVLGSVLNAASLTLDEVLGGLVAGRTAVEAQLALGASFWTAAGSVIRGAIRRGLVPVVNQMSAAGVVTLPGIMTGQILAGMDPMDAVKYQILLMFLLSGGAGLAAVATAFAAASRLTDDRSRLRLDRLAPPSERN